MTVIFSNNASTVLAQNIFVTDGFVELAAGTGALFPNPVGAEEFYVTVENYATKEIEIMICTERTGDTLTVLRAQEGTAVLAFDKDTSVVQNRVTAETLDKIKAAGGGSGLPIGGLEDTILAKDSSADGDAVWKSHIKPTYVSIRDAGSGVARPALQVTDSSVAVPHSGFVFEDFGGELRVSFSESGSKTTGYAFNKTAFDFKFPVSINGDLVWDAGSFDPTSKEDGLGNPGADGNVLSSTIAGVRSWVSPTAGGAVPSGGATGALLNKLSAADGDTGWTVVPTVQILNIEDALAAPLLKIKSLQGGIPSGHEGYEFRDESGTFLFGRYDTGVADWLASYDPSTDIFDFLIAGDVRINGSHVITSADGVLLDTDAPTLTGVWTHDNYIRLTNNFFLQGKTVGGTNTTLLGIDATDKVALGNLALPMTIYAATDPIIDIDGQPQETMFHTGNFDPTTKEDALGNPGTDGYILSSTIAGARSWVPASGGGFDVAGDYTVTGDWVFSIGPSDVAPIFKADNSSSGKAVINAKGVGDRDYFAVTIDSDVVANGETTLRAYDNVGTTWRDMMAMEPATGVCRFDEPIAVDDALGVRVQQPRIFVQAGDPGAAASDGDLWIW